MIRGYKADRNTGAGRFVLPIRRAMEKLAAY
jgi:hypothetical protein